GVRLALGAAPTTVRRMFLVEGARLAGWGALIGAGAAAALARGIRSLLFGVGPLDPVTFLAVPLLLGAVTLVAAWIPAARATRIDPLGAIRAE
ncbi:MAG: FtsX-like permease family protein, partial [Gemmatimonadales bacterium]|nr:FtsX-like permease family protein [Gemmatimonadales bacterium]